MDDLCGFDYCITVCVIDCLDSLLGFYLCIVCMSGGVAPVKEGFVFFGSHMLVSPLGHSERLQTAI